MRELVSSGICIDSWGKSSISMNSFDTDLRSKMMPESSELGEVTVVNPEGPYWFPVDPQDGCLVFLRWNGLAHRKAWFQNFMAHHYSITGHLVHVLALASPNINSTTVVMHSVDNYKYFFEAKR